MSLTTASAELDTPPLRRERPRDGFVRLTLSSPPANALSEAMLDALQEALDEAAADETVRVVAIGALGKLYSGGHDLKEMTARRSDPDGGRAYFQDVFARCSRLMQSILALPKPVVAEVRGLATAAGCQLVASCDIAIAADTARFGVNGIDVGLFCSTPMVALSRNVSPKTALDMLMTGEMISAERAREAGLVSRVVAGSELQGGDGAGRRPAARAPAAGACARQAGLLSPARHAHRRRLPLHLRDDRRQHAHGRGGRGDRRVHRKAAPSWPGA